MPLAVSLALFAGLLALCWCYTWLGLRWAGVAAATTEPPRHFAAVDGLRGVLALSAFVHHAVGTRRWYATGTWNAGGLPVFE